MRRRLTTCALTGVLLAVTAAPAAADPAGPTTYRSTVTGVEGDDGRVAVDVLGGDAFVALTVTAGTEVQVEGYDGEPYLRFAPDGTVERNEASPARWLNDARYGGLDVTVPPEASPDAPPRWEPVADGGRYAWHDHRVHWMSPGPPPDVDTGLAEVQRVTDWELELLVDGEPLTVAGELDWVPRTSPAIPAIIVAVVIGLGGIAVWRRPSAAPLVGIVGAVAAATVGVAGAVGLPPGADVDVALLILPAVAVALAGVGFAVRRREGVGAKVVGALAGLPILVWSALLLSALTAPIVPTVLPDAAARALVAVALGTGVVAIGAAARAVLTPPSDVSPAVADAAGPA